MSIPDGWVGRGWLYPAEPGVPSFSHEDGWHWVAWPSTGTMMAVSWCSDLWVWNCTWLGNFINPEEVKFLDYIGEATCPRNPYTKLPQLSDSRLV